MLTYGSSVLPYNGGNMKLVHSIELDDETNFYFKVTPSYFTDDSEPLIFTDPTTLSDFLNYSQYRCKVEIRQLNNNK